MKYKYKIEPRDLVYLNYNIIGEKHYKRLKGYMLFTPTLLLAVLAISQFRNGSRPSLTFILIALVILILWARSTGKVLDALSTKRLGKIFKNKDNQWLLNERTMEVTEDRLIETIDHLKGLEEKVLLDTSYKDLYTVDRSKEGIYLFVNNKSAFIIPSRAFKDDLEMEETYAFIEERFYKASTQKQEDSQDREEDLAEKTSPLD